jgi:hypothetical protein
MQTIIDEEYLLLIIYKLLLTTSLLGKCRCDKVTVNGTVWCPSESANISWIGPTNFTCPHKYIFESMENPKMTSPEYFMLGEHNIPYIYNLYGGEKVTCNVEVNVRFKVNSTSSKEQGQ